MKSESSGPAGAAQREAAEAQRRSAPTPLEAFVGILVIATLMLAAAWAVRGGAGPAGGGAAVDYSEAPPPAGTTVALVIDFGNGVERRFSGIPWKDAMTAADVLDAARGMSPGLAYGVRGSGEMSLLTSLDGVANGSGDGRYWFYEVNGRRGEVSFAAHPIAAGDRVLWTFKKPE